MIRFSHQSVENRKHQDCLADINDMGAHGLEILANGHIDNDPDPSEEWLENWFRLLGKYEIILSLYQPVRKQHFKAPCLPFKHYRILWPVVFGPVSAV